MSNGKTRPLMPMGRNPLIGPFTTVCPSCNSHWGGKRTYTVYDVNSMRKVCNIHAYPERTRDEALGLAVAIADILNEYAGHKTTEDSC
jgi:hypothetical protein